MRDFYETNSVLYFEETAHVEADSILSPFVRYLPERAKVLDVGCGSGRDLRWLKNRGYLTAGLERSEGLARLAREFSDCEVTAGDFESVDFRQWQVDGLVMVGALVHISHERLKDVLAHILQSLVPGGVILLTLKEGAGFREHSDGRVFTLWRIDQLEQIFVDLKLKVLDFSRQVSKIRPDDIWLGYVLRR